MAKPGKRRAGKLDIDWNTNIELPRTCTDLIREIPGLIAPLGGSDFAVEYLHSEYLSKFNDERLVPAEVRRTRAVDKLLRTEDRNRETNRRLRATDRGFNILPRVSFFRFLEHAQRIVSEVLGPLPDEWLPSSGSFTGGASTSRSRQESHPANKYVGQADVTEEAEYLVDVIHHEVPLFRKMGVFYDLRVVDGASLFTVPKKTDIDRCACKEPDVNMFLQKGVGKHIRRSLLKVGINLNDQSINRRLAYSGSITGELATLDLSAASDSVTTSLVLALLPYDWYRYLNDIRSPRIVVDGRTFRTELFSTMGNGFTFELESLLFYALVRTTMYFEGIRGVVSIYGDDIVCPVEGAEMAIWVLSYFGFETNPDKTFVAGPFRESCGGHYYLGEDVTPFYLKQEATVLTDLIRVANQLRRWALADPARQVTTDCVPLWYWLASFVPIKYWGGCDLAVDTQLVSPGAASRRLQRVTDQADVAQEGLYLQWHNSNWNRRADPEVGFPPVETQRKCRDRKAKPGARNLNLWFIQELEDESLIR